MITVAEIELKKTSSLTQPDSLDLSQNDSQALLHSESSQRKHEKRMVLRKLFYVMILATVFMTLEIIGGLLADSIAIISDAAHMLSDLLSFIISIVSVWISTFPTSSRNSFGYHRAGVVGALASVVLIWILTGFLVYHAITRIIYIDSAELDANIMLITSILGLGMNLVMIKVLHADHDHSHGHSHGHSHNHNHGHSSHQHDHKCNSNHHHRHHAQNYSPPNKATSKNEKLEDYHNCPSTPKECDDNHHRHEGKHSKESTPNKDPLQKQEHAFSPSRAKLEFTSATEDIDLTQESTSPTKIIEIKQTILDKDETEASKHKIKSHNQHLHHHHHQHSHNHNHDHDHKHSHHDDLNLRAAVIHIIGDILQSIGVIIASIIIKINPERLKIIDPLLTILFSIIVLFTTKRIVKDCWNVIMQATPHEYDLEEINRQISNVPSVIGVHNLHMWSLTIGKPILTAHVYVDGDSALVLKSISDLCRKLDIHHSTIQIEAIKDDEHPAYVNCKHDIC